MFNDIFYFDKDKTSLTTYNKNTPLETQPHYTDSRFKTEQTVFGKIPKSGFGHKGLEYVYSDRLWQWDYEKAEQSSAVATNAGHPLRSCTWYEAFLSAYLGKTIVIEHIVTGVNVSNGYPYYVLGYKDAA